MKGWSHELRVALRYFARRPLFAAVTLAILTLGLMAAVAIFTYINAFFRPFPGVESDGLVRLFAVEPAEPYGDLSYLDFEDYADNVESLQNLAAVQPYYAASVRREGFTEVAFLEAVTGSFFPLAEVEMSIGRGLTVDDDRLESEPAAVIAYEWWQRSFGGERSVLGQTLYLNYRPFTIVGVAAPDFLGTTSDFRPNVWIPIAHFRDRYTGWNAAAEDRDTPLVRVFGRLVRRSSRKSAAVELDGLAATLDEAYPGRASARQLRLDEATWIDPRARNEERAAIRLMVVTALGLLLLVCANVANLLLAVAATRQREMATRVAFGASRWHLLRSLLAESVLLSLVAGVVGLVLAGPSSSWIGSYFARPSVWGEHVARQTSVDMRVIAFAFAVSVATGVIAGLLPALRASRPDLMVALKAGGWESEPGVRTLLGLRLPGARSLLVSTQVTLAVVLLVYAGLVLRTYGSVRSLDPGFDYAHLIASHVSTSSTNLKPEERGAFFERLREQLAAEPWVESVVVAENALLSPQSSDRFRIEGQREPVELLTTRVLPGFFEPLDIELIEGRDLSDRDRAGAPDVVVVNQALARRFYGETWPVGRHLWQLSDQGSMERSFEIVGVVEDFRARDFLAQVEPMVFYSYPQHPHPTGSALHVASRGDPGAAVIRLQRWLRDFEPHLAIVNVLPYTEVVDGFLYAQRRNAELFSTLALLGLALAAAGIFAVLSLSVSRSTREIGIRMAIGAERRSIGRLMIGRALVPVLIGLLLGLGTSLALTPLAESLLYGVEPADPLTLTAGALLLIFVSLLAAWLPARRAARLDPARALQKEG